MKENFKCNQCGFFELTDLMVGDCRRSAPEQGGWPMVEVDDWCGDFEPSQEEIAKRKKALNVAYAIIDDVSLNNNDSED